MIAVLVNTAAVIVGSLLGLLFRKALPARIADAAMTAIGACSVFIGISGAMDGTNVLITIASMVLGVIAGTLLNIDGNLNRLGKWVERKLTKQEKTDGNDDGHSTVAQGFVTGSLLFCVGAMTVVGCLNEGLSGNHDMLYTKSLLDFISSMMLSASLGIGVMLAAAFVFVFQGALVLLAGLLAPVLTEFAVAEMTCVGSLMILLIGLNLLGIKGKNGAFKAADFLPALLAAPIICTIMDLC